MIQLKWGIPITLRIQVLSLVLVLVIRFNSLAVILSVGIYAGIYFRINGILI